MLSLRLFRQTHYRLHLAPLLLSPSGDKSRNWRVKSVRNLRKRKWKRNMLFSKTSPDSTGNISPQGNTCMAVFNCHICAIFHSSINLKVLKGFQTQACSIFNKFNLFYTEKNTKLMFPRQNAGNNFYEFKQSPRPCQLREDCYRTPFYLHAEAEPVLRLLYCGVVPQAACLDPCWQWWDCWQVLTFLLCSEEYGKGLRNRPVLSYETLIKEATVIYWCGMPSVCCEYV